MKIKIFLSHSSNIKDSIIVQRVVDELKKNGFEPYLADRDLHPGKPINEKISNEISNSDFMLVLWTDSSSRSKWVNQEIGYAEAAKIPYCIIVEKGLTPEGFPSNREFFYLDKQKLSDNIKELTVAILREISSRKEHEILPPKAIPSAEELAINVSGCIAHSFGELIITGNDIVASAVRCGNCGAIYGHYVSMGSGIMTCGNCGATLAKR